MVGQHEEHLVQLHRDTVTSSWGFRLQGGQESSTPLTVQRVFVGGAADGKLHRGDIIVAIGGQNARGMYHSQAEDIIKKASRDLSFKVLRGEQSERSMNQNNFHSQQVPDHQQQQPFPPSWQSTSFGGGGGGGGGGGPSYEPDDDYERRSIGEIKQKFSQPSVPAGRIRMQPQIGSTSYVPKRPFIIKKSGRQFEGLADPGWTPQTKSSAPSRHQHYQPIGHRSLSPPINRQAGRLPPPSQPIHHENPEPPAWIGTLRSSGGPRRWEIEEGESLVGGGARVPSAARYEPPGRPAVYSSTGPMAGGVQVHQPRAQAARYGPGGNAPTYDQYSAEGVDSETARVAHLQYNTPIGLYSKNSAKEALEGQTHGKAGYGTMQITGTGEQGRGGKSFDPAHSDVYRMILEEEEGRKHHGGGGGGARRQGAPRSASSAAASNHRPHPHPPSQSSQQQQQEQHSAKYHQLLHENDDQSEQYTRIHPEHYQHQQPTVAGMRDVESHFNDMGVSDF